MHHSDSTRLGGDTVRKSSPSRQAFVEAVTALSAAIATLPCVLAITPEPGPGVLAVVLCLSLSRSHLDRDQRGRIEAAIVLPVVSLAASGIGSLLLHFPVLGALLFATGMFVSIWLRRFGPTAHRVGSLIALPFVVLLTVPYVPPKHPTPLPPMLIPVVVSTLALIWVNVVHALAKVMRMIPSENFPQRPAVQARESSLRPMASTRMAIQMAVALLLSFTIGYEWFSKHWSWVVLTAFIVSSGNRGRLDVAYKSVLRVLGAAAGTIVALSTDVASQGFATVALILATVFLAVWLRPLGYAWWALFITLALALLQQFAGVPASQVLQLRLEEIAVGAVIGVASAWFVLPVRSTAVLRRRIADALSTLSTALSPENTARSSRDFVSAVTAVEQAAPAFRAIRHITRHIWSIQPADWIDALVDCRDTAGRLIEEGRVPPRARVAVVDARKSMREPNEILPALQRLHSTLREASGLRV